jgi:hypothetical protein
MNAIFVALFALFSGSLHSNPQLAPAGETRAEEEVITVIGEVREPMKIRSHRRIKLTRIIAFCGGLTAEADERAIVVFGSRGIAIYDLRRIRHSTREPFVELGETVYVRDR